MEVLFLSFVRSLYRPSAREYLNDVEEGRRFYSVRRASYSGQNDVSFLTAIRNDFVSEKCCKNYGVYFARSVLL